MFQADHISVLKLHPQKKPKKNLNSEMVILSAIGRSSKTVKKIELCIYLSIYSVSLSDNLPQIKSLGDCSLCPRWF